MNETFSFDYLSLVYDNNKYSLAKLIFFFFFFFLLKSSVHGWENKIYS